MIIMKNNDIIEKILKLGTFLSFSALIVTVLLQVITRYFVPSVTLVWTEEGSRFLFKFAVAFGAPLAMKKEEFVNVDILLNLLSRKVRDIFEIIIHIMTIGLFAILFKESLGLVQLGQRQQSPTLGIPMSIAYSAITIASFFILIYGVINMYRYIQDFMKRGREA
ncbi:TRAP transporter small permease [Alkalibacter saccharofermentans]|uniref:TRAP-type C4-dicarboxylate transport system, small permease component n=1 Tax=Alkalibacter saccharofermentans DSM 14828 TaxID=1120975 RepID=A0A1M4TRF7_9FIRM|nr:TRAP transporter small permease [Alkalibacter saccharofermentans]SHE46996.1 TRAP-type C4-dicarboxylate transport system, small permease component [Alkalibacter saccharofermentans DSM 14828]